MLSQPDSRRAYDRACKGPSKAHRAPPAPARSPHPRTRTSPPTNQTPRANPPSAFAQQRAREAVWEHGGKAGAAIARAVRRQQKMRQEAAARARAALRQDGRDGVGARSDTDGPLRQPPSGWTAQASADIPGGNGATKDRGSDRGPVAPVFDWAGVGVRMPFLRNGCGMRVVRNEAQIAQEILRSDTAEAAANSVQRSPARFGSEWDEWRQSLAQQSFRKAAQQLVLKQVGMENVSHNVEWKRRDALAEPLVQILWQRILPETLDHSEAVRAVKVVWCTSDESLPPRDAAHEEDLKWLFAAYFACKVDCILVLSCNISSYGGLCRPSSAGSLKDGPQRRAAQTPCSDIISGAVIVFQTPPFEHIEALVEGVGLRGDVIDKRCQEDAEANQRHERARDVKGAIHSAHAELDRLQSMLGGTELKVGWVVEGQRFDFRATEAKSAVRQGPQPSSPHLHRPAARPPRAHPDSAEHSSPRAWQNDQPCGSQSVGVTGRMVPCSVQRAFAAAVERKCETELNVAQAPDARAGMPYQPWHEPRKRQCADAYWQSPRAAAASEPPSRAHREQEPVDGRSGSDSGGDGQGSRHGRRAAWISKRRMNVAEALMHELMHHDPDGPITVASNYTSAMDACTAGQRRGDGRVRVSRVRRHVRDFDEDAK